MFENLHERRFAIATLVYLAICLLPPLAAQAQWSPNGNDIYNSNSGNVGIGLTTPSPRLYVAGGAYGSVGNANQNIYALGAQTIAADYSIILTGRFVC